jgi:hypothetical protein
MEMTELAMESNDDSHGIAAHHFSFWDGLPRFNSGAAISARLQSISRSE